MTASAAIVIGCAMNPPSSAEGERDKLLQRQGGFLAALSAQDAGKAAGYFADDAEVHIANMEPIVGREAIGRMYENVFRFLSSSDYTPADMRISAGGDVAYGTGSVTNVFVQDQGHVEFPGKYLVVWEKRDGDWLITAYSVSSNRQADRTGAD